MMVAVYIYTQIPVPKVLAWSSDPSNTVGAEYIIMEKAPGVPLSEKWEGMPESDQFRLIRQLTMLEGELTAIQFPASGSLYLRETLGENDTYNALEHDADPAQKFCVGPSCARDWYTQHETASPHLHSNKGPCGFVLRLCCSVLIPRLGQIYPLSVWDLRSVSSLEQSEMPRWSKLT
jgi:hypothetical protein